MIRSTFLTVILLSLSIVGFCQGYSIAHHNLSLNLSNAIDLHFTSGANGVNMNFTTPNQFQNGITITSAARINVRSNKNFNMTVKSASNYFSSPSATQMPVTDVLWVKRNAQSSFINLSTTDQTIVANGNRGIRNYNITYKATPGFNFDGGTYIANIVYTATQQ